MSLDKILELPEHFQPRGDRIDERHTQELLKAAKAHGDLDPIMVIAVGDDYYLIDGHHRVAAYRLVGATKPVPVQYFDGSLDDAVLVTGSLNTKAKLPMMKLGRRQVAWLRGEGWR